MKIKNLKLGSCAAVLLTVGLFSISNTQIVKADKAQMAEAPKSRKLTGGQEIPGKYAFSPKIIPGITKVTAFGNAHWATSHSGATWSPQDRNAAYRNTSWLTFDRDKDVNLKGKLGVLYSNVGVFNGHTIDAKVTITDWNTMSPLAESDQLSNYSKMTQNRIGISTSFFGGVAQPGNGEVGYNALRFRIDMLDHDTHQPIKVSGRYTFEDGAAGIVLSPSTYQHISDVYYTDDTELDPFNVKGWYFFHHDERKHNDWTQDDYGGKTDDFASFHRQKQRSITMTYDNMSSFDGVSLTVTGGKPRRNTKMLNGMNNVDWARDHGATVWQDEKDPDQYYFTYTQKAVKELDPDALSGSYDSNLGYDPVSVDQQVQPEVFTGSQVKWNLAAIGDLTPQKPQKFVADSDEGTIDPSQVLLLNKGVYHNTLKNRYEKYHYAITHTVPNVKVFPGSPDDQTYKSYSITDKLDKVLDGASNVKVYDDQNQDVTYRFNIQTKDNTLKVIAKPSTLTQEDFYNNTYKVTFDTDVKPGVSLADHIDAEHKDQALVENKPVVEIDNNSVDGNTTKTNIPFVPDNTDKHVSTDGNGDTTKLDVDFGKEYKYRVDADVPDNVNVTSLELTDQLEKVQDIKDVKVYDYDDKDSNGKPRDITDQGKLTTDDNLVDWKANTPSKWHGKHIKMFITATVRNTPDLLKYLDKDNTIKIPNEAHFKFNDKDKVTNKTEVTPNTPPASVSKKIEVSDDSTGTQIDKSDLDKQTNKKDESTGVKSGMMFSFFKPLFRLFK